MPACDVRAFHDPSLGGVRTIMFSPDSSLLFSAGYDGCVAVFKLRRTVIPKSSDPQFSFGPTPIQAAFIRKTKLSPHLSECDVLEEKPEDMSFAERKVFIRENVSSMAHGVNRTEVLSALSHT